jgi:hypothetical protein
MRTLQVTVSDSEYADLQEVAAARETSLEQVLQEALTSIRREESRRRGLLRTLPLLPGHRPVAGLPTRADLYEEMFSVNDPGSRQ